MKKILVFTFLFIIFFSFSQQKIDKNKIQTLDVSCGQCQFKMTEKKGCDLAVLIDGKPYFIVGTTIDEHGDAHAKDGFCEAVRKAKVIGELKDSKFYITYFELIIDKKNE